MSPPRLPDDVVISGIGCRSPLGSDATTFWRRLLAGESGVRRLTPANFHGLPVSDSPGFPLVGAPVADEPYSSSRPLHPIADHEQEPVTRLIGTASTEALAESRLAWADVDRSRIGCVIGTSKGGLITAARLLNAAANRPESRGDWADVPPHAGSTAIAARWDLRGPCLAPVAACATGLVSVLRGCELIREGCCDVVLAGSGDASLHPAVLASFRRMGVLAAGRHEPATACRPFNRDRDGFVVGEGAAVFVLERRRNALARGVQPIATVLGGMLLSDPSGLTRVDPQGGTLARAIGDTLRRAQVSADDIGHVHLHGTATRTNDPAEAHALRAVFGDRPRLPACVALKGVLGHLLGASGAVELAATALTLRDGRLPPTATLTDLDPACALPLSPLPVSVTGTALKVSLGFGGHVAVACLGPA